MMGIVQIHVQVDPFALRGDFEFLVTFYVGEIGTNKHFCDVPVPKLVGFLASIRSGLKMQLLVGANKQEIQVFVFPKLSFSM